MNVIVYIIAATLLLGIIELLTRRYKLESVFSRRLAHLTSALLALTLPHFYTRNEIIFLGLFFALVLLISRRGKLLSSVHCVERRTLGDVYLPLGIAGMAYLFLPSSPAAFQYGLLIMGISDALAGFVGEKFGKHFIHFFGNKKSLEGSLVFFVSALVITLACAPSMSWALLLLAPVALTIVEFCSTRGLDNLLLPLVAGILLIA